MSINTLVEYWNDPPEKDVIRVIVHSRKKFYGGDIDISWYEFEVDGVPLHELGHEDILPIQFLRIEGTNYYEFGGTSKEATKSLTDNGFRLIVNGNEL